MELGARRAPEAPAPCKRDAHWPHDLLTRGQGLAAILDSIVVLLGFSAAFFVIGAWRFEFE